MIVRIATEDQYELSQDDYERVNELDNTVVAAVDADDEAAFKSSFAELIEFVRSKGTAVEDDALVHSDVILPPSDTSFEQAKAEFTGDGLIPESVVPD